MDEEGLIDLDDPTVVARLQQTARVTLARRLGTRQVLPPEFLAFTRLVELSVADNALSRLTHLPVTLVSLDASGNRLENLDDGFARLSQLQRLRLSRNRLSAFPSVLARMPSLENVTLFRNAIAQLPSPSAFLFPERLRWLDLSDNPVVASEEGSGSAFAAHFPNACVDVPLPDRVPVAGLRLFVGGEGSARNGPGLASLGVTRVLSVCHWDEGSVVDGPHRVLRISDSLDADLLGILEDALMFLDVAAAAGEAVLVHCNAGVSRSPSIVVAYLMLRGERLSFDAALATVRTARSCAGPNEHFVRLLRSLDGEVSFVLASPPL